MSTAEEVFQCLDREVWAVSSGSVERPAALLATWVMQASLDPQRPVLLAGIAPNHRTAERIDETQLLAAHLLKPDQAAVGLRLAGSSLRDNPDKLQGLAFREASAALAAPVLKDCLAWVAGRVFARLAAGDRIFYWVEILKAERLHQDPPLRQSQLLAAADEPTREALREDRKRDIQLQRPWGEAWRRALPELLRPRPCGARR